MLITYRVQGFGVKVLRVTVQHHSFRSPKLWSSRHDAVSGLGCFEQAKLESCLRIGGEA